MKTVIAGINAKYIHTALSVRSIASYLKSNGFEEIRALEFTINQPYDHILERLYMEDPAVLLLSCYIWNWEICRRLIPDLRTLRPSLPIYLGGPQVSFHARAILDQVPADGIVRGEGEEAVRVLLEALSSGGELSGVPSLTLRSGGSIIENPSAPPLDLAALPFCYEDLSALQNQIIYYESGRGCPFSCTYCLSGADRSLRFKPLATVFAELQRFLAAGVRQVKFCDRTFNCRSEHCNEIWRYLIQHDSGATNFHFEITAGLLDERQLNLLAGARPGLFQFEIGVQSTYPPTLEAVCRAADSSHLTKVCRALKQMGNIHLHLDLIAGLPLESAQRFSESFDEVYRLEPDQLQLGFLKLLPGSAMEQQRGQYGIDCRNAPPYEVLRTAVLSADALFHLKRIARMVDSFYNSGAFTGPLRRLEAYFGRPFDLYSALADRYASRGYFDAPPSRAALKKLLAEMLEGYRAD